MLHAIPQPLQKVFYLTVPLLPDSRYDLNLIHHQTVLLHEQKQRHMYMEGLDICHPYDKLKAQAATHRIHPESSLVSGPETSEVAIVWQPTSGTANLFKHLSMDCFPLDGRDA